MPVCAARENRWATTSDGDVGFDGTVSREKAGIGDPDGREVYRSSCVGHKHIIPLEPLGADDARRITFRVTEAAGEAKLRDVGLY